MALGWTQPLTELSTTNLPRYKAWPAMKAENLTSISEAIIEKNKCAEIDVSV
jgi:hypothetical protein